MSEYQLLVSYKVLNVLKQTFTFSHDDIQNFVRGAGGYEDMS